MVVLEARVLFAIRVRPDHNEIIGPLFPIAPFERLLAVRQAPLR